MPYRNPILCVDDEPANLALIRQILQEHYRLVFARNGKEALQAIEKHQPSLMLLDVEMPDISGYDVARQIKNNPLAQNTPIIFVTSLSSEIDEQTGFEVGGVDYITKPISPPILRARVRTHLTLVRATALEESHRTAIHMLGQAGHYNDTDTGVHIWRMAAYSSLLAQAVGWDKENTDLLELAAPMHDTGKIGIPDAILKKPGPLTSDEWSVMQTHCMIGHQILNKSNAPLFQLAAEIALHHHERWDGSGYPDGLRGDEIPESARITALADVFDALSMRRPYKEPWPLPKIIETLKESQNKHLEGRLVKLFLDILPEVLKIQEHWKKIEETDT